MRIPDDFSSLDLRQQALATRMLHHEARTSTIASWTGLGADRIRGLAARLSPAQRARALHRVRGHAPTQPHSFLRPHVRHREAAALAALFKEIGAVSAELSACPSGAFHSLERGEQLCEAYERYRQGKPERPIPFEYAVLLLTALEHTHELALAQCARCDGPWLFDPYGAPHQHCPRCAPRSQLVSWVYESRRPREPEDTAPPYQLPLFDFLPTPPTPPIPTVPPAPNARLAAAVAAATPPASAPRLSASTAARQSAVSPNDARCENARSKPDTTPEAPRPPSDPVEED